jgi:hypothetical protein
MQGPLEMLDSNDFAFHLRPGALTRKPSSSMPPQDIGKPKRQKQHEPKAISGRVRTRKEETR